MEEIVKYTCALVMAICILILSPAANGDTVVLKNGDRLTGVIEGSDAKQIALKTEYAGEIQVQWSFVKDLSSEKPLYVETPEKGTVSGKVTFEGEDLVVHSASAGEVRVPLARVTVVRSVEDQQAYEKSLHPGLLESWTGGVNVGFAIARGNSDTTNLTTGFTANRKTLSDAIRLYSNSIYTDNGPSTSGVPVGVTANAILAGARYDRNFDKSLFAFVSGDFTHDELQDLNLRAIYSAGLGWHAINTPSTTFDLLAGANYTRETYGSGVAGTPGVTRNLAGLTLGEDFMHKFGSSATLTQDFTFYPDLSDFSQYRFSFDAALVAKINKWLGWQTSVNDRYVTNPPVLGTKSNDVILSTGLKIAFGH